MGFRIFHGVKKIIVKKFIIKFIQIVPFNLQKLIYRFISANSLSKNESFFCARDSNLSVAVNYIDKARSTRYLLPFSVLWNKLITSYCVDNVSLEEGDLIVDVGANIGEFSLAMAATCKNLKFVCVEPSKREFHALQKNMLEFNAQTLNVGAWNESSEMTLYIKSDTADSSLFEFHGYKEKYSVKLEPLDKLFSELDNIKLLKIEAEGAEPEILLGAKETLKKVSYLTVDGGPERGFNQESTIEQVINILGADFKCIKLNLKRGTILFKNINIK